MADEVQGSENKVSTATPEVGVDQGSDGDRLSDLEREQEALRRAREAELADFTQSEGGNGYENLHYGERGLDDEQVAPIASNNEEFSFYAGTDAVQYSFGVAGGAGTVGSLESNSNLVDVDPLDGIADDSNFISVTERTGPDFTPPIVEVSSAEANGESSEAAASSFTVERQDQSDASENEGLLRRSANDEETRQAAEEGEQPAAEVADEAAQNAEPSVQPQPEGSDENGAEGTVSPEIVTEPEQPTVPEQSAIDSSPEPAPEAEGAVEPEAPTPTEEKVAEPAGNNAPTGVSLENTEVAENAEGAVIGDLSATDIDDGDTHSFTVSDDRFEVVDGQLKLKEGQSLDHEVADAIDVTVTATDAGGLETSETFTLSVSDVNEGPTDVNLSNLTVVAENARRRCHRRQSVGDGY